MQIFSWNIMVNANIKICMILKHIQRCKVMNMLYKILRKCTYGVATCAYTCTYQTFSLQNTKGHLILQGPKQETKCR